MCVCVCKWRNSVSTIHTSSPLCATHVLQHITLCCCSVRDNRSTLLIDTVCVCYMELLLQQLLRTLSFES
ncbi:Uncharacterized protein APZ42_016612 [Daphnia magna]|uniref:Uncharacterized protein n=1 Tax=Daphnia magna TaxID=35525 RepID=A0A0P5WSF9_9CRUS|nr:Uncharacterized protein APZ42_016612 [Daphnia magna]